MAREKAKRRKELEATPMFQATTPAMHDLFHNKILDVEVWDYSSGKGHLISEKMTMSQMNPKIFPCGYIFATKRGLLNEGIRSVLARIRLKGNQRLVVRDKRCPIPFESYLRMMNANQAGVPLWRITPLGHCSLAKELGLAEKLLWSDNVRPHWQGEGIYEYNQHFLQHFLNQTNTGPYTGGGLSQENMLQQKMIRSNWVLPT